MKIRLSKKPLQYLKTPWILIKSLDSFRCYIINRALFLVLGIKYTEFPKIKGTVFARNQGYIQLGEKVNINSGRAHNAVGGNNKMILYSTPTGNINIGNIDGMSNSCLYSMCSITIEDDVIIGSGVQIYDTDFHSLTLEKRMLLKNDPDIRKSPVLIETGVFIGTNVIILKGVTIGTRSVIGAGSVVSKNIPANEIWAGNPAKFIKNVPI